MSQLRKLLVVASLAAGTLAVGVPAAGAQTATPPATYSLASWQRFGDPGQQGRDTCTGFAMVAAIEARYRRQWGRSLDLSEQYYWHVYKSTSIDYPRNFKYENQSSYWGGGSILGLEAARTYAIPTEAAVPYKSKTAMNTLRASIPAAGQLVWNGNPALNTVTQDQVDAFEYSTSYIPTSARQDARYGVSAYTNYPRATANDTGALERIIASNREVLVGLKLNWKWNADNTVRVYDSSANDGNHAFLLIGYDRNAKTFLVKNSWGETAPIKVSYELIQKSAYEAASVDSVPDPRNISSTKGRFLGQWNLDFDGWRGKMTVRRTADINNGVIRFGHFLQDGTTTPMAVNGNTIDASRGIRFSVENSNDPPPSQQNGTPQSAWHSTMGTSFASGRNVWAGIPFGTLMSRSTIPTVAGSFTPDKWVGKWRLVDDGNNYGTLTITSVGAPVNGTRTLTGSFLSSAGVTRSIKATTNPDHVLSLAIATPTDTKSYTLHFHTRETNVLSGWTLPIGGLELREAHALRA